jgi:predicted Fe-Mo cluster-binding NifX family protein
VINSVAWLQPQSFEDVTVDSRIGLIARYMVFLTEMENRGKVAICGFENRVCPRFDLTRDILIFDGSGMEKIEEIDVSLVDPEKKLKALADMDVSILITGGIQERFQEMFHQANIRVIWGVIGEIKDVLEAYQKGILYSGIGPVSGTPISPS